MLNTVLNEEMGELMEYQQVMKCPKYQKLLCSLLAVFWYQQELITRQNGYNGPHFKATWGNT